MREARKKQRFEALARPELDALYRTARRIVGRRAVAEEIVQEACLRAFAGFGQNVSKGCIRMLDAHVIELFEAVPIGARVTVTRESLVAPVGGRVGARRHHRHGS